MPEKISAVLRSSSRARRDLPLRNIKIISAWAASSKSFLPQQWPTTSTMNWMGIKGPVRPTPRQQQRAGHPLQAPPTQSLGLQPLTQSLWNIRRDISLSRWPSFIHLIATFGTAKITVRTFRLCHSSITREDREAYYCRYHFFSCSGFERSYPFFKQLELGKSDHIPYTSSPHYGSITVDDT